MKASLSPARLRQALLLLLVLLLCARAPLHAGDGERDGAQELRAGAASLSLTDDDGLARTHALVLSHGATTVALASVDLPALPGDLHEAAALACGPLRLDALVLVATRSATALRGWTGSPLLRSEAGALDPAQRSALAQRIAAAVAQAHATRGPARLRLAQSAGSAGDGSGARPLGVLRVLDEAEATRALVLQGAVAAADGPANALARRLEQGPGAAGAALLLPALGETWAARAAADAVPGARLLARLSGATRVEPTARAPDALEVLQRRVTLRTALLRVVRGADAPVHGMGTVEAPSVTLRLGDLLLRTVPGALLREPVLARSAAGGEPPDAAHAWTVPLAQDHLGAFGAARGVLRTTEGPALFEPDALERLLGEEEARSVPPAADPAPAPSTGPLLLRAAPSSGGWLADGAALGRAAGRARRAEIHALLARWLPLLAARAAQAAPPDGEPDAYGLALDPAARGWASLAEAARHATARWPEEWLDELEAGAQEAGVPVDALRIANAAWDEAEHGEPPCAPQALVVHGDATTMGQTLHAWSGVARDGDLLAAFGEPVLCEPATGHPFACVRVPGIVGAQAGLSLSGLSVSCERFEAGRADEDGVPPSLLVRQVLQYADDVEEAQRLLSETPVAGGVRFTVCDGRRLEARVIERQGGRVQVRGGQDGLLLQCDPDASVECFLTRCDPEIPRALGGSAAARRLREALEPRLGRVRAPLLGALQGEAGQLDERTLCLALADPALLILSASCGADLDPGQGLLVYQDLHLLDLLSPGRRAAYAPPWPAPDAGAFALGSETRSADGVRLADVRFTSAAPSGHARNDAIHGVLYRPAAQSGGTLRGAVIALPAWKESNLAGQGLIALHLAKQGYAVLVMPLPWQVDRATQGVSSGAWTLSADLGRTRAAFLQGAADVARASRWLEAELGVLPAKQAVMGVSLGGHVAALAYGAYPERFAAGCFLLTGGGLTRAMLSENRLTGPIRAQLLERGVTPQEARALVHDVDGATWASPERRAGVLLVGADADDVVPPENVRALADAYGGARLEWIRGDHHAILRHFGRVLDWVVDHLGSTIGRP